MPINDIIAEQAGTMATASEAARGGADSSTSSETGAQQSQPAAQGRGPTLTLNGVTYDRDDMVFAMMAAQTVLLVLLVMRL
jgi:hypothetical protein